MNTRLRIFRCWDWITRYHHSHYQDCSLLQCIFLLKEHYFPHFSRNRADFMKLWEHKENSEPIPACSVGRERMILWKLGKSWNYKITFNLTDQLDRAALATQNCSPLWFCRGRIWIHERITLCNNNIITSSVSPKKWGSVFQAQLVYVYVYLCVLLNIF